MPPCLYRPEVTNGLFLSHKRTERERRWARVAEFRRKRRLSLRTALTGNRCFPTGRATTLQIAGNWQLIVSLVHHASPVPPYVRLCVKSKRSVTSGRHVCTFAGSRSGKGRSAILPNMLHYPGSVLATDPKGELATVTARRRAAMGQAVHVLDPFAV